MNILVLGCGLVGSAIAIDLAKETSFRVTVADISEASLARLSGLSSVRCVREDLSSTERVRELAASFDLVIGAVPGFMGYRTVQSVIEAGRNIVDISFFPEDCFELDALAKQCGVTAVVDCGVAPGCGNILLAHVHGLLDRTTSFLCYVGGLPVVRRLPYEYAAVFSPIDVIEEYTRPARYIEHGNLIVKPALTDIEPLDFAGVGTLEAFNSDGLRSLAITLPVPDMKEKTLRYPGHVALMKALRDTGFFGKDPIDVNGTMMRPLDLTAKLLFPAWQLPAGEEDITIMRVVVDGEKNGKALRYSYDMLDRYDRTTKTTSMARTTGYTCSVAARLVASGAYARKGISPPEYLGKDAAVYEALMAGLRERNVVFHETVETVSQEL
jgi:saccharopine dehydrogenase-like NADP-dependent oxidoreductase